MPYNSTPYNYCPVCGQTLQETVIDNYLRKTCPVCSFVHWGDYSLGVGGVLWHEGKVLLVQRRHNPGKGMWTIPGGYVNQDEPIGDAVKREIFEETGIRTKPLSLIALHDRPSEKHDAYIIFLMDYLGGTLQGQDEEVSNLGFFTLEECQNLALPSVTLQALKASHSATPGLTLNSKAELLSPLSAIYQIF
ncbi:NUDIX hydrolase [Desulfosporosinus sp. PR]|uniref:NUDIX hydrolase n=1 Tax=Candidatus Desulfosporosinus nitrosoreducens TaxID=3401928 RepID=UPI0027FC9A56|nr:NUDIX hydrolase [Desulfosporosinus sp. PR]MDQ7095250.1 NUDIX hydrolase [Desulfosporosinus sp. PR]